MSDSDRDEPAFASHSVPADLIGRALQFLAQDVDSSDRGELESLVKRAQTGDVHATAELGERFSGPLRFGTAGIRGVMGAGETRFNRSLVRRITYGLVRHLKAKIADSEQRGIVIGRDGRRLSDVFQKDAAFVCGEMGMVVRWVEGPQPTPLIAFAVRHFQAAAGIVITASHNPSGYNGYKVYWENGAQIVPPHDAEIAEEYDRAPPAKRIPYRAQSLKPALDLQGAYLDALNDLRLVPELDVSPVRIAYTALHGVGQRLFVAAMIRRGFRNLFPVEAQAEPDGSFPSLPFPNPEEPGVLDLVVSEAREHECDLALAHDPDADRLGAAVRNASGDYVLLSGNELGALLASHVLSHTKADRPLVISTVVSSRLVQRIAAAANARYEDTLTGFKWIANEAMRIESEEECSFVFGYEEALGFTVGTAVRDKDGIGAALVLAEAAATSRARGRTLIDELEALYERHGRFVSRQRSVILNGEDGTRRIREAMRRLRSEPVWRVGSEDVSAIWDLADGAYRRSDGSREERGRHRSDVIVYDLADGGRFAVRPSGTEPKIKFYMEIIATGKAGDSSDERLSRAEKELLERAGLVNES